MAGYEKWQDNKKDALPLKNSLLQQQFITPVLHMMQCIIHIVKNTDIYLKGNVRNFQKIK